MKTVNFKIGIRPVEDTLNEAKNTLKKISSGENISEEDLTVYFPDFATMKKILTDERIRLLKEIKHNHFSSVYELTKYLGRDSKNVNEDVKYLADIGLIKLIVSNEARKTYIPSVEYEKISLEVML